MTVSRSTWRTSTRVLLASLLAAATLPAQAAGRVAGRVTSSDGGAAILGATVQLVGTPFGTITKADGTYSIALRPGAYTLRVRQIGYASSTQAITIAAGQALTRDVRLERSATNLEAVAVVGTRDAERTVVKSPVPVDVFSAVDLKATGRTETAQMIQALAPSVNFPRSAIADGTDAVRPATLRGLGADQVLVLVNGKRRHTTALINVNGTVGRGQSAVDLNAIPASMIDHVEILRDGAAAQYGSDAIAGVINIVLKSTAPTEVNLQSGVTALGDGRVMQGSANAGVANSRGGYFHAGLEVRDRQHTDRSSADLRTQYFAGDAREATINRINNRYGDGQTSDIVGMFTAGTQLGRGVDFYAFGGTSRRAATAPGFWRRPNDDRTIRSLYPNGFLPFINSTLWDASTAAGVKGSLAGWKWDLSQTVGRNSHNFFISNTNNASFGNASKTAFDAGTLIFSEATSNLDLFREVKAGTVPVRLAAGAEWRKDQFQITQGEPGSWQDGKVPVLDASGNPTTRTAAAGSQVFPGFRPTDETNVSRTSTSLYADVESDLTSMLLLGGAVRYENYSDFGSQATGKVTARFAPVPQFAVRGGYSTGFRAPSLQQSWFTATSTNFIGGVPFEIRTFPVSSRPAQLLGAKPLTAEKSKNTSAGVTWQPVGALSLTADYYRIDIADRVVLSENLTQVAVRDFLAANGEPGIGGGRFFTNAIDTRTTGLDVVANYGLNFGRKGILRLTAGVSQNKTIITAQKQVTPPALAALNDALYSRVERGRVEKGQPRDNYVFSATHEVSKFTFTARTQRFGEVTAFGTVPANDQTYGAKWITDASIGLALRENVKFTFGADNLFDVYPDQNIPVNANNGIFPYAGISPFGFNGRFAYARLNLRF
ncbi:MAG: TonB-dependent receptor [Gemmatimonadaceae bacterium]|nr:TonB-dependent receptor [Gemmatimonadaceae bacterium]